jgi:hypothetical protein
VDRSEVQPSLQSLCRSKGRRNWTGAPRSHHLPRRAVGRTWAENGGRSPSIAFVSPAGRMRGSCGLDFVRLVLTQPLQVRRGIFKHTSRLLITVLCGLADTGPHPNE